MALYEHDEQSGQGVKFLFSSGATPTAISVFWVNDAGTSWSHYTVNIAPSSGLSVNGYPVNTTEMQFTFTGLRPNTMYTVAVTPWDTGVNGSGMMEDFSTDEIPVGEILVSDVTSDSAFLQWKDYSVVYYSLMMSPNGSVETLGGIFETEVGITILMPDTLITVTLANGVSREVLASVNFTSGAAETTSESDTDIPPPKRNSGSSQFHLWAYLTSLLVSIASLLL
ncbi:uncharacterized protein LOC121406283 [Lytechinus variegatus]|uniref:uncharacterized protein LOC121406283 n=1 Tax=Lytechinus variegatus TaxID=7654 RepID=UPI001BB156F2|nr:uncharacterized protein LOC121406283 [Lytechinus variegatus]